MSDPLEPVRVWCREALRAFPGAQIVKRPIRPATAEANRGRA